jgi:ABC-type polar amino acid transport system ATPase subunit
MSTRPTDTGPILQAIGIYKSYGPFEVLKGIDLQLTRGQVVALIGPSGSGKSTFIRCLNQLETPTGGVVRFRGRAIGSDFHDRGETVGIGTLRRNVGMVFQHFNLFPHMTALGNVIEGPITVLKKPRREAEEQARELLARVGLSQKCDAYPAHLSGGQKQRVAIARALAMEPEVLLLDEVTSALDPELVGEVLGVIRGLADAGMTMAIVTHEMAFAADVSDRVLFFDGGVVAEQGTAAQILGHPESERLRGFLARFHQ